MEKAEIYDVTNEKAKGETFRLVPYLVATTAVSALVVVCVLGSLYIHDLKHTIIENTDRSRDTEGTHKKTINTEFDDSESGTVKEAITVDDDNKNELIVQTNSTGHLINVVSADFEKGVLGVYSYAKDSCFIVIGASTFLPSWEKLQESRTKSEAMAVQKLKLLPVSDTPLDDKNVLPGDLIPYCQTRPLYWAQIINNDQQGSGERIIKRRSKRGGKVYVKIGSVEISVEWQ